MTCDERSRVLVVDDDDAVRVSLMLLLQSEGHEVRVAGDPLQALAILRGWTPQLIVSDMDMPIMSGGEFASIVRRRFPLVRVVIASGRAVPAVVPCDAVHVKGSSVAMLLRQVSEQLQLSQERDRRVEGPKPVWVRSNGKDVSGTPYVLLTCQECLRSFAVAIVPDLTDVVQAVPCSSCSAMLSYVVEAGRAGETSPPRKPVDSDRSTTLPHAHAAVTRVQG